MDPRDKVPPLGCFVFTQELRLSTNECGNFGHEMRNLVEVAGRWQHEGEYSTSRRDCMMACEQHVTTARNQNCD